MLLKLSSFSDKLLLKLSNVCDLLIDNDELFELFWGYLIQGNQNKWIKFLPNFIFPFDPIELMIKMKLELHKMNLIDETEGLVQQISEFRYFA